MPDIWNITGHDVHPPLYYWMLHFVYLIFGNNILVFRMFSCLAVIILGILGYTHIRKDFGDKTGILFSFFTYFLPIICLYSQEIRMYSWASLFVAIMAIYAYRFYKNKKLKDLITFGIFSIASCYMHYYALVTAGLVNLILLIYFIIYAKKDKKPLIQFLIATGIQILLYIPWLIYLISQMSSVKNEFWIRHITRIDALVGVLSFEFQTFKQTDVAFEYSAETVIALIFSVIVYTYTLYRIYKEKKQKTDLKPLIFSLITYWGVVIIIALISLAMPILFARYLMVMVGIYVFALAYITSRDNKQWITIVLCVIILVFGIYSNCKNIKQNYDESNMKQIEYIKENLEENDIFIYSDIGNGGVLAAFFHNNKQYFYNGSHWNVEEAYKAYAPRMEIIYDYKDILENYHGKIWISGYSVSDVWDDLPKDGITILKDVKKFETKYQNYTYSIMLLNKE